MKINSDTHKLIVTPKSYLYLSEYPKNKYELLPEKYWLKFLVPKDCEIFDLNFMWLLERGYLISKPEMYTIGIPTITKRTANHYFIHDENIWMCNCEVNTLHFEGNSCDKCGWDLLAMSGVDYSDPIILRTTDQLWGKDWKKPEFVENQFFDGKNPITTEYLFEKNKYSKNRELIYRMPPQNFFEVIFHTIKGTIFSPFKPITREEVENYANGYRGF